MDQSQNQRCRRNVDGPIYGITVAAGHEILMPLIAGREKHVHAQRPEMSVFDMGIAHGPAQQVGQDAIFRYVAEHILQIGHPRCQVGVVRSG